MEIEKSNKIDVNLINEKFEGCRLSKDDILFIEIDVTSKLSSLSLISLEVGFLE